MVSFIGMLTLVHPFATTWHFAPVGSMSLDFQVASLSYKSSSFATSRGNEKIGGTGYCVTYDTDSQSRNVLASPLGEEDHEVAKGVQANWIHRGAPRPANPVRRHPAKSVWTVVILIMILYVDVTAERRHYNTHRSPKGETTHYILRVASAPSSTAVTDSLDF